MWRRSTHRRRRPRPSCHWCEVVRASGSECFLEASADASAEDGFFLIFADPAAARPVPRDRTAVPSPPERSARPSPTRTIRHSVLVEGQSKVVPDVF
jgi:hypothetical protein